MKKRFLFPVIYLIVEALAFLLPLEGILFILNSPVSLVILGVELASGVGQGIFTSKVYLFISGCITQYFLIGYAWDKIAEYFQNKKYWDTPI